MTPPLPSRDGNLGTLSYTTGYGTSEAGLLDGSSLSLCAILHSLRVFCDVLVDSNLLHHAGAFILAAFLWRVEGGDKQGDRIIHFQQ
jgi:hypothetical protein